MAMKRKQLCAPLHPYEDKRQNLKKTLLQLNILYPVLYEIILDYLNEIWKKNDFNFDFNIPLVGFIVVPDHIYVLGVSSGYILQHYDTIGRLQNEVRFFSHEVHINIDFDEIDKTIYLQYPSTMYRFDWKLCSPQSWKFHNSSKEMFGFKIDTFQKDQMFVSTNSSILRCKKKTGEVLMEWKFQDDKDKNCFRGLTITDEFIYVCQCKKDQIDVIQKNTGKIHTSWKNLRLVFPTRIHLDKKDELFYVGDMNNIHVVTSNGLCMETLYSMKVGERVIDFSLVGKFLYLLERDHRKSLYVWERTM